MTKQEFFVLTNEMKAVYAGQKFIPDKVSMEVWYKLLCDIPFDLAEKAVVKYMQTEKFPPTPADIRSLAEEINRGSEMGEAEAWAMVYKAICRSNYESEEQFDKLPPMIQKAVGSARQLRTWAADSDFNSSVESSNFKRAYREVLDAEKRNASVSDRLKVGSTPRKDLLEG